MITIKCQICKKEFYFYPYPSWSKRKFCSRKCYWISLKGQHHSPKTEIKKGQKPWNTGKKCPQLTGKNHWRWKNGETMSWNGYLLIRSIGHPSVSKTGYIRHSRLVAEKYLGRYLTKQEVIHHINGIKTDDRPENLYLFTCFGHKQYEALKNKPLLTSNII